jgi:hypothetical protein
MAASSSAYRRPGGLTLALQILTGIDLVLDFFVLAIVASTLPALARTSEQMADMAIGGSVVILMVQIGLRLALLIVRAAWTLRLARNAGLFSRFPVTTFWAWAGFFIPVVSLWLPVSHMLALGVARKRQNPWLNPLCLAWALTRWLTCVSGASTVLIVLIAAVAYHQVVYGHPMVAQNPFIALTLCLVLAIAGGLSAALSLVLVPWIARRQPAPDQLHHVEVF